MMWWPPLVGLTNFLYYKIIDIPLILFDKKLELCMDKYCSEEMVVFYCHFVNLPKLWSLS